MLSNTGCVILGLLQKQPMSGYDIKGHIDLTAGFFFPASYSQIYPELKKLEAEGLVEGTQADTGRRSRTEYAITRAGRAMLAEWLADPSADSELRDEGLLKFFFGGSLTREELLAKVDAMKSMRAAELARLNELADNLPELADELQQMTLEFGISFYEYVISWCEQTAATLAARPEADFPVDKIASGSGE